MKPHQGLEVAQRLAALGVEVRSAELEVEAERYRVFYEGGGNRRIRRAAKKQARAKR